MEITHCTSGNRDMILHVLETETGKKAVYHPSPGFSVSVGEYTLYKNGVLETIQDTFGIFYTLSALDLCDYRIEKTQAEPGDDTAPWNYPISEHSGRTLLNLFCIFSSRQRLLNQALAAKNGFFISTELMNDLLSHPPVTVSEFYQALYKKEVAYRGIYVDHTGIRFTGFINCPIEDAWIHRQLADLIIAASLSLNWVKPFTPNVRNRKYAFRTWLNAIGMKGPEYEEARRILLSRLYGRSDQRTMPLSHKEQRRKRA